MKASLRVTLYGGGLAVLCAFAAAYSGSGQPLTSELPKTVEIKDLTWVEVRTAIQAGYKTALVPTGGIEQNGPHMILGKHDYIVAWAANRIAREAGATLVAPIVSYVPEGDYEPATGHMRFPGTIGVTPAAFASVLEGIARSLKAHGFTYILYMGDHGQSQPVQSEVAARLSQEWKHDGVRVFNLDAYYDDAAQIKRLEAEGETSGSIGQHAALIDTSELMAVHSAGVTLAKLPPVDAATEPTGASGDPARASAQRGADLIAMRVEAAVAQITALRLPH
jgi:creatinine amidohydrolase/Fe(II)-dependent formamide hydrolase-like protein